jgi:uncharacterized membrane protein (DUF485 family)
MINIHQHPLCAYLIACYILYILIYAFDKTPLPITWDVEKSEHVFAFIITWIFLSWLFVPLIIIGYLKKLLFLFLFP